MPDPFQKYFQRFCHILLKIVIGAGEWCAYLFQGVRIAFSFIFKGAKSAASFSLPFLLWLYKSWLALRQRAARFLRPAEKRVFYLLANRYLVHFLIFVLVMLSSAGSLKASADTKHLTAGEGTMLFELLGQASEDIEEIGLPLELEGEEGFFLDIPIQELEPDLPLVFEDQALFKIDISPIGLIPTRLSPEEYIVQAGDTITSIAQQFNVSVNTILWENKLGPYDIIRPGQKLTILPTTGISHKIKKGDTIERLAKLYGTTQEEIKSFNNLTEGEPLEIDRALIVPGGVPYSPPKPAMPKKQPSPPTTPAPAKIAGPGLIWPTSVYRITQYFSWRHPGVDIAGPKGTPIYAADDGVVILVEQRSTGYGWQIMIDHENGFQTRYAHNSQNLVKVGQRVKKGEAIAAIGSTGRSSGPHVHFEIYVFGSRVNPLNYVRK